jgi:hypothetical protein
VPTRVIRLTRAKSQPCATAFVRSAGVEPATSRLSTWPLCQLEYEHVEPLPGADPGHPRYEGRGRSRAQRLGWDTRLRTWMLRVQGPAGLPVPPYPIGAGGGSRTRTSSSSPSFELGAAAYYATPACAARESNPVSPIKSRVLHRYSPRRLLEPHAGIEPAFLAWKASTLAIVLVRRGDSGWDRTSALLGFNQALVPTELQSHQSGWQDSNLRFPDPKSGALPSWTTSRRRRDSRT